MVISSIDLKAMASLVQSMSTAATTLEESAASIRSTSERVWGPVTEPAKIKGIAGWARDQVPGLRRRLALAQQIEAQARGFQPSVQIDESQLSTVPPDAAIAQGAAAAKKLKESGADLDPELIAEIAKYQNDPYFAAGLARNMTPAELGDLVLAISRKSDAIPRSQGMPDAIKAWEQKYTALITAVGTTMGTATRNTGELALPDDYASRWVTAITAEPGRDVPEGQGAAASVVLRFGSYSTAFLDTVSSKVYDYERQLGDHADREWRKRSGSSRFTSPYLPDGSYGTDPLANILEGLSHNPQAAQNFFDVANPHAAQAEGLQISGRSVNDRLKYLLQDRKWAVGAELGHALEVATTNWRDHGPQDKVSATIAAQTFALIGQRTAAGDNWTMPTGLRPGVAKMLAAYMPSVYRMYGVKNPQADPAGGSWVIGTDDKVFPPGQPFGVKLDPAQVEQILGTLGENESDIEIVTAGALATEQVRMRYALDQQLAANPRAPIELLTGTSVPLLENAGREGAGVLGWVVRTAYAGDLAEEELAKKRRELMAKTVTTLTGLPLFRYGEGVGEWSKYAFDQLKDRAIKEIGTAPKPTSQQVYGDMDPETQQALAYGTLNLLLQAGYLRPEHFAAANKAKGGAIYQAPPPTALKGHSGANGTWVVDQPPQFDPASDAYRNWSRTYAPNTWISNNIYVPYNLEWPHKP